MNKDGEQIFHPGGKLAPDLTLPKLKARLESVVPEEHPTARRNQPTTVWRQATDALDTLHTDLADTGTGDGGDVRAQAHITALGKLIEANVQQAPAALRAELRSAAKAFTRAQRSQIRAEDRRTRPAQRGPRHRPHRHRAGRQFPRRPGRGARLGCDRCRTVARGQGACPAG